MNVLIFDATEAECHASETRIMLSDDTLATAYGACDTLASNCERDAQEMAASGRHQLAQALRESATKYREASRILQGG